MKKTVRVFVMLNKVKYLPEKCCFPLMSILANWRQQIRALERHVLDCDNADARPRHIACLVQLV